MDAAEDFNLGGVNFWEWYTARQIPNMWQTIAGYHWPEPQTVNFLYRRQVRADVPVLNVRSGPSTSYSKIGSLKAGTRVTVFEVQGVWVRISPDRSLWVSSDYLDWLP
jgi:uncharacterized protein YgiM (DUF1202 family)